jgi:hypothetical protein
MDGTSAALGANYTIDPSWHVITTGDFNGDSKSDILWQNTSGAATIWLMDGPASPLGGPIYDIDPSWKAIDTGDFNGDGTSDILWQNTSGAVTIWLMNGTHAAVGATYTVDPSWHAIATGDFNGNNMSDILWQNTNGAATIWLMEGASPTLYYGVPSPVGGPIYDVNPSWHAVGTGDFDGDGKSDIIWQNTSGTTTIWQMDSFNATGGPIYSVDPSWHLVVS